MIDLYYWTTPNGHKITMCLEEWGIEYQIHPVHIARGEQFKPEFLAISPNNRIPAIVDQHPLTGDKPIAVFESGAILLYLAEKYQRLPQEMHQRYSILQWLFWQMGGLGPMAGQNHHFTQYAPEPIDYAINRYRNETNRLYGVVNRQLARHEYVAGADYSIADMAIYPWIVPHQKQGQNLSDFPHLERWFGIVSQRASTLAAYARATSINTAPTVVDKEARSFLFNQTAKTLSSGE